MFRWFPLRQPAGGTILQQPNIFPRKIPARGCQNGCGSMSQKIKRTTETKTETKKKT
jgi:hypothetical protein